MEEPKISGAVITTTTAKILAYYLHDSENAFFFEAELSDTPSNSIQFLILKYQFTFPSLFSKSKRQKSGYNFIFFFRKLSGKPDQAEKFFQIARKVSSGSHIGFNWSKPHALFKLETPSAFKMDTMVVLSF